MRDRARWVGSCGVVLTGLVAMTGCDHEASSERVRTERPSPPEAAPHTVVHEDGTVELYDVEAQTRELVGYYTSIRLTPDEEEVKREALAPLPAPCCAEYSALTCCCECNLSRSVWGLSHHMIRSGRSAGEVRAGVQAWLAHVNPAGHTGDSCFTGGCGRPFADNGCGGMRPDQLVF